MPKTDNERVRMIMLQQLFATIARQLPKPEIHGLGATLLVLTLGLLGYYEYTGNEANAHEVLMVLLGLLAPAALRSQNDTSSTDEPKDGAEG